MATTTALTENSRQGINSKIPPCIGLEARLSRNLRPGCGHGYDETPVGLVVYVRNDPVNYIDPDGRTPERIWNGDEWIDVIIGDPMDPSEADPERDPADWTEPSPGSGSGGLNIRGTNTSSWWLKYWHKVNVSITEQMRRDILAKAVTNVSGRMARDDCRGFLIKAISKLNGSDPESKITPTLRSDITTPEDLIGKVLSNVTIYLYGAETTHRLNIYGVAFAESSDAAINLGENFYNDSKYQNTNGDQTSTIIHELFQVGIASPSGKSTLDFTLDSLFGNGSFGSWGDAVRTNCGVKSP